MSSKLVNSIGWVGNQLLAWCGAPMVFDVINKKSADGYAWGFIVMWGLGEILALIYMYNKHKDYPTMINYSINLAFILIVCYYKL